jgi:hypothetical protein
MARIASWLNGTSGDRSGRGHLFAGCSNCETRLQTTASLGGQGRVTTQSGQSPEKVTGPQSGIKLTLEGAAWACRNGCRDGRRLELCLYCA